MKKRIHTILSCLGLITLIFGLQSCGGTKSNYQQEYARVWNELLKSKDWQESLNIEQTVQNKELYASVDSEVVLAESPKFDPNFQDKYQSLVSRAYFKIITEAEKADARISAEYNLLNENTGKKKTTEIIKKYEAHKAMLDGLKSWNIFSENRSGDLEYFKLENKEAIQKKISNGDGDAQIVNFLIYKLADLYHVEEN